MCWPFVRTIVEREEVESTSDLARTLLESEAIDLPMAVRARRQTKGRGRGTNSWWSDEGSLTFTLGLDPEAHGLRREHEPRIALAVGTTVVETLPRQVRAGIRWPNDIEVAGRKLGGILPERIETKHGPRILIGIGLNLETSFDRAAPEVRRMAISLREVVGVICVNHDDILREFFRRLPFTLLRLANDEPGLAKAWQELDTLRGQIVRVDLGPRIIRGVAKGIDVEGALVVSVDGETTRLFGGRVLREPIS